MYIDCVTSVSVSRMANKTQLSLSMAFVKTKMTNFQWLVAYCYIFGNENHLATSLATLALAKVLNDLLNYG